MAQLIYGKGGLSSIPLAIESQLLDAADLALVVEGVGDLTSASPTIASVTSGAIADARVGMKLYGLGIPVGATILSKTVNSITMSAPATTTIGASNFVAVDDSPAPSPFADCTVRLFVTPIPNIKLASAVDVVEPTYDGYVQSSPVAWDTIFYSPSNNAVQTGDKKQFYCTGPTVTDVILGAAYFAADGLVLVQVDVFATPVSMGAAGNAFDYVPLSTLAAPFLG